MTKYMARSRTSPTYSRTSGGASIKVLYGLLLVVQLGQATAARHGAPPPPAPIPPPAGVTAEECNRRYRDSLKRAAEGDFEGVINLLDVADCYNRNPEWLGILGQAHDRLNRPERALWYLQHYLCVNLSMEARGERKRDVQGVIQEDKELLLKQELDRADALIKGERYDQALKALDRLAGGDFGPRPECRAAETPSPAAKDGRDLLLRMQAQLGQARKLKPAVWAKGDAGRQQAAAVRAAADQALATGKQLEARPGLAPLVRGELLRCRQEALALRNTGDSVSRPIYTRWWLWTAVGAVAAGVVAGSVVGACPWCKHYPDSRQIDFSLTVRP